MVGVWLNKFQVIEGRDRVIDPAFIGLFTEALDDLDPHRVEVGFKKYMRQGNRFPWPADIRELAEM